MSDRSSNLVAVLRKSATALDTAEMLPEAFLPQRLRQAADEIECLTAERYRLTKALRIAELKASGTLANNLCPDHRDKQTGRPCLACEIERLEQRQENWLKSSPPVETSEK